jgi:hypothetical protein
MYFNKVFSYVDIPTTSYYSRPPALIMMQTHSFSPNPQFLKRSALTISDLKLILLPGTGFVM